MNSALALVYSAYGAKPKAQRRGKPGPMRQRPRGLRQPSKVSEDRKGGKSAEPRRMSRLPPLQSKTPEPCHGVKVLDRSASSSVDISLERLERLQFKSITARSEWLSLQERKMALGFAKRKGMDTSLDEIEEVPFDNKCDLLAYRYEGGKPMHFLPDVPHLPPLRRPSPSSPVR